MKNRNIYKQHSIQAILDFPSNAVFALIHEELKLAYFTHAKDMVVGLNKILGHLKNNKKLGPILAEFEVRVFDIDPYQKNRELAIGFLMDEYREKEYKILNTKKPLRFKSSRIAKKDTLYYVYLVSARNTKYIVAVFASAQEAKDFYIANYRNKVIERVIYSDNKLTQDYLNKKTLKVFT